MAVTNTLKTQTRKMVACLGFALALTPLAIAQQFQTPTMPGQSTTAIPQQFQARMQHAEALKAQMMRAQFEQGAPGEFAEKAFQAQQTYVAERAFAEYSAYVKKQKELEQYSANLVQPNLVQPNLIQADFVQPNLVQPNLVHADFVQSDQETVNPAPIVAQTDFRDPVKRLPNPEQPTGGYSTVPSSPAPNQQSTFVPPVHIAPTANFNDDPKTLPGDLNSQSRELEQLGYQKPDTQQYRTPAQPLYQYQASSTSNSRPPGPTSRQREYILQENSSGGLQDVISSLLSKNRYSNSDSSMPQYNRSVQSSTAVSALASRESQAAQDRITQHLAGASPREATGSSPRRRARPRFPSMANPRSNRQPMTRSNQRSQSTRPRQARRLPPAVSPRQATAVRHAFNTQIPIDGTAQGRRAFQQVVMVEPAQDPFNDGTVAPPPEANFLAMRGPLEFEQSSPSSGLNQQSVSIPPVDDRPMKQISVLSNSSQDAASGQDNQFGSPPLSPSDPQQPGQSFQPSQDNALRGQDQLGNQSTQDLQKVDEELNRRLQELEGGQGEEKSKIDAMVEELEKDVLKNRGEQKDSIFDQDLEGILAEDFDEKSLSTVLQTCDQFRNELLKGSIRDIALDISPKASPYRDPDAATPRDWIDRAGNIVATGTMVDLRRGYVIIDGPDGQQKVSYAKLSDADWAVISAYWRTPQLCSVGNQGDATRSWSPQTYTWKASALCHKPLFFENIQLERYGHTHGPISQPIRSVAHFFVSFVTVPYQSGMHRATECEYALGFYRPGNCAPWLKDPIPFSLNGAFRQAVATTAIAIIP